MAEQNFPDNTIHELDNLDMLRGMNSDTVDLIATALPPNTKPSQSPPEDTYWSTIMSQDTNQHK